MSDKTKDGRSARSLRIGLTFTCFSAAMLARSAATRATVLNLDLENLTSSQIEAGYAANLYTPTDITETYLAQITKYQPVYDAYEQLNPSVLSDAAALTAQMQSPGFVIPDPLWGIPTAVKDGMNVAGLRTTAGSAYLGTANTGNGGAPAVGAIDLIPAQDCTQVARLRSAGALILGKTNVNDFYRTGNNSNSTLNGNTRNAYDISRTPGGSSGGSGVAVATGMACIATAEETGSSITNPSSASSIVGIKPTFGTIPSDGVFPLQGYYRDTDGNFGKTVRDAAAMLDVEAGPSPNDTKPNPVNNNIPNGGFVKYINDHPNALAGSRIGVLDLTGKGFSTTKVTNIDTGTLFNRELAKMSAAGATLVTDPFVANNATNAANDWVNLNSNVPASNTFSYDIKTYLATLGPDSIHSTQEYDAKVASFSGKLWYQIPNMPSETLVNGVHNEDDPATRADLAPYNQRVADVRALFKQIMDANDLDALVLPQLASPVGSLPNGSISRTPGSAPNLMGTPGVTVPGGYYPDGTPFEMYFIGDLNMDAEILALAADYESVSEDRVAPVLVATVPEPAMAVLGLPLLLAMRRRRGDRAM